MNASKGRGQRGSISRGTHGRDRLCASLLALGCAVTLAALAPPAQAQTATQAQAYRIPAGGLDEALNQLAAQSKLQIVYSPELVSGKTTRGVSGSFTATEALRRLLEGTGLAWDAVNASTLVLKRGTPPSPPPTRKPRTSSPEPAEAGQEVTELERLVVTGSRIAGVGPIGSPSLSFGELDFQRTGAATVAEFLQTVPQNYSVGLDGVAVSGVVGAIGDLDRTTNRGFGVAVNLRGLGPGSTLVLVNGRRLAKSGDQEFFDISTIPMTAVDRIEMLLDGASAIYGSDAIGGVVNIILKKDYQGAQTRLLVGGRSGGGGATRQIGQTFGTSWGTGNMFVSAEHHEKERIGAQNVDWLVYREDLGSPAPRPEEDVPRYNLTPREEMDALSLSAVQRLGSAAELSADVRMSNRSADLQWLEPDTSFAGGVIDKNVSRIGSTRTRAASLGLRYAVSDDWTANVVASFDKTTTRALARDDLQLMPGGLGGTWYLHKEKVQQAEATVDGRLFDLPAGEVRMAGGVGHIADSLDQLFGYVTRPEFDSEDGGSGSRIVQEYGFTEFAVPLLGSAEYAGVRQNEPRLALSLAARYERSNLFESSFNPKYGIRWIAADGVQLRGSYSTSFKAPTGYQLSDVGASYSLQTLADPALPGGQMRYVRILGGNPNLQPETARTRTLGLDFEPKSLPGFTASLTYYDIAYRDRIGSLSPNVLLNLIDPAYGGIRVLREDVGDAAFDRLVGDLLANPNGYYISRCFGTTSGRGPCAEPSSNFGAIIFNNTRNLAATRDRGLDIQLGQRVDTRWGQLSFNANIAYIDSYLRQITATAPEIEQVDTIYNPRSLKARTSVGWSDRGWSVLGTWEYGNGYLNNAITPTTTFPSWSSFNLNVRKDFNGDSWLTRGLSLILNVDNVFDRAPPTYYLNDLSGFPKYDAANYDPYGRTATLQLIKEW